MGFAQITLSGLLSSVREDGEFNAVGTFKPSGEDTKQVKLVAYGKMAQELLSVEAGSPLVVCGSAKPLGTNSLEINLDGYAIALETKLPMNLIVCTGKFKLWSSKQVNGKTVLDFAVSYSAGKVDGKTIYDSWRFTAWDKVADQIEKYFKDGKAIAIRSGTVGWRAYNDSEDKPVVSLSLTARAWAFVEESRA